MTASRDGAGQFRRTARNYCESTDGCTSVITTREDFRRDAYVGTGTVVYRTYVVKTQVSSTDVASVGTVYEVTRLVRRYVRPREYRGRSIANFHHLDEGAYVTWGAPVDHRVDADELVSVRTGDDGGAISVSHPDVAQRFAGAKVEHPVAYDQAGEVTSAWRWVISTGGVNHTALLVGHYSLDAVRVQIGKRWTLESDLIRCNRRSVSFASSTHTGRDLRGYEGPRQRDVVTARVFAEDDGVRYTYFELLGTAVGEGRYQWRQTTSPQAGAQRRRHCSKG